MIDYLNPNFADLPGRRPVRKMYRLSGAAVGGPIDVSVITPYFNTEELFAETYTAVRAQSLQNWEWVIVDDGSTDAASVARLTNLAQGDQRIQIIHQENAGPGAARNRGFESSRGRYICLLDSDDMIEPTYLEKCMWFLDSNPEFAFCNSQSVVFGDQQYLWTQGFGRGKEHLRANSGPPISLVRRGAFAAVGGFDASIRFGHEDWDFWLAMAKAGHWGYTIPEFLQWYRKRSSGRFEDIMRSGNVNEEFEKLIRRKYAELELAFPNPQRRPPQPYETLPSTWPARNRLRGNSNGRRILFILPWMVVGGADRVNLDLLEGLTGRGHEITVCATLTADHRWEHKFSELTPDVFVLPNILHLVDYPRFLAYLIESRQVDTVVVSASTIGYQLLPFLGATAPNVAFVDLSHVEESHWLNGGHPRFGVGYQDALDLNVVTTKSLVDWMESRGSDRSRVRQIYTGVRIPSGDRSGQSRAAIRAEFGITEEIRMIVFAGRLCEQKRPALLAEILKCARDATQKFHALIIGEGEQRQLLESLLDRYQLRPFVQMLGSIAHSRWLDILSAADILLMPSQYEGISVALLEAMAAGVVPVVARVGGQEEIVGPEQGYLVPHGNAEVQEYVRVLGRLTGDAHELRSKSTACRELMAEKYSWQRTTSDFEGILTEAHQFKGSRRCQFSIGIGRELASLALEYKRLSDALDWLWNTKHQAERSSGDAPAIATDALPVVRLALLLSYSKVGRALLRNNWIRKIGRRAIVRMEAAK